MREIESSHEGFVWPESVEEGIKDNLISHIAEYIDRLTGGPGHLDMESIVHSRDENGFLSYPTFHYENQDHRFIVTWKRENIFEIRYISKDRENAMQLREENKSLRKTIDKLWERINSSSNGELPF